MHGWRSCERPLDLGCLSNRRVSLEVAASTEFPECETVESVLIQLTSQRNFVNHFVALTLLRDTWSLLAGGVQELEGG